jgi:menaquinone-dependent protoporphyrinogen oxidase
MRIQYVMDRFRAADHALEAHADLWQGLYAAHLQLHTVLPEHLPEGPLRAGFTRIHDAFRRRRPSDQRETSVIEVIGRLDQESAQTLASEIRSLCAAVETLPPEVLHPPSQQVPSSRTRRTFAPPQHRAPRVLILYGSTEGHTRGVAEFAADKLQAAGCEVVARTAIEAERNRDLERADGVIVAASLHWGMYQTSVSKFVARHNAALNARPNAFLSVSLAAAGVEQPETPSLDECVDAFVSETSWAPDAVHHVGGGIRHSGYDYFKRLAAHLIGQLHGAAAAGELDLADYGALERFLLGFLALPVGQPASGAGDESATARQHQSAGISPPTS